MEIVRSLWSRPDFFLWVAIAATAAPAKNAASGRRTEYRTSTTAEQPLHHLNPPPEPANENSPAQVSSMAVDE
jgi:hypothetical protein